MDRTIHTRENIDEIRNYHEQAHVRSFNHASHPRVNITWMFHWFIITLHTFTRTSLRACHLPKRVLITQSVLMRVHCVTHCDVERLKMPLHWRDDPASYPHTPPHDCPTTIAVKSWHCDHVDRQRRMTKSATSSLLSFPMARVESLHSQNIHANNRRESSHVFTSEHEHFSTPTNVPITNCQQQL